MINKTGYVFRGTSDCEIAVALYEYYGVAFLSHLRGEFALCLYDSNRQLFLASRDRSGVKPMFWTIVDNRLLLTSKAKALLSYGWQPEWDVCSIVTSAWLTEERTIFKGVQKVRPGYYMTCIGSAFMTQRQYWDHDYPDKHTRHGMLKKLSKVFALDYWRQYGSGFKRMYPSVSTFRVASIPPS